MAERVGELEVGQDLGFQRREWRVQRIAWVAMAMVLVAGLAGLLGSGPLAHAAAEAEGLTVEYDRIVRDRAPFDLRFVLPPGTAPSGQVDLWIDRALLDKAEIARVVPQPESERAGADRVVFTVAVTDPDAPAEVIVALDPHDVGGFAVGVGIVDGPQVELTGFVLP
jgi:hypothetical protein